MGKAMQPVSINGIEFDALMNQDDTFEANVPEYSVEKGFPVSDAIIITPDKISMTLYLTNTPVTWHSLHGSSNSRVGAVCSNLQELFFKKKPVTVTTTDGTYEEMAIESLTISKTVENGYSREIPIKLKKIYTVSSSTTTIPASYGKSGASMAAAGTSSTSSVSSSASSASSSVGSLSSSGLSSGLSGSSGSSRKSSILYSVASSNGLL